MRSGAWWRVAVLLASVKLGHNDVGDAGGHYTHGYDYDDDDVDFSDNYDEEVIITTALAMIAEHETRTRVRRYGTEMNSNPNDERYREVKDVLKQLLPGRKVYFPTRVSDYVGTFQVSFHITNEQFYNPTELSSYLCIENSTAVRLSPKNWRITGPFEVLTPQTLKLIYNDTSKFNNRSHLRVLGLPSNIYKGIEDSGNLTGYTLGSKLADFIFRGDTPNPYVMTPDDRNGIDNTTNTFDNGRGSELSPRNRTGYTIDAHLTRTRWATLNLYQAESIFRGDTPNPNVMTDDPVQIENITSTYDTMTYESNSEVTLHVPEDTRNRMTYAVKLKKSKTPESLLRHDYYYDTTTTEGATNKTPHYLFNLQSLIDLITNLTADYDANLTRKLNETLRNFSVPTCPPITTPTVTTTPLPDYSLFNATVMGKCFVCGLETIKIPMNAHCADAFAGDFLPLTPVDTRAKGKIANFRKYCRYRDVNHYITNASQPRSIFGRWTGGCSVRWVDLSGIYTQRSCRNRERPVLGLHYASKRMAKLEMALINMDNGCIISPMATLLPFSRGISLYARFHACVCTGSWCNRCALHQPWMLRFALLLYFIAKDFIT